MEKDMNIITRWFKRRRLEFLLDIRRTLEQSINDQSEIEALQKELQ
jgi:hypothetical protein